MFHRRYRPALLLLPLLACASAQAAPARTARPSAAAQRKAAPPRPTRPSAPPVRGAATTPPRAVVQTPFEGRVVSVRRGKFPNAQLVLDLYRVGRSTVMRGRGDRSRLPVTVQLVRNKDKTISMSLPKNVNLAGAYYLMAGDTIRGDIRHTGSGWILESVERVGALPPPKVASLSVELNTDKETYGLGEDVRMTLNVRNTGTAPAVFNFSSGQRYEFVVRDDGREIWRWSRGRAFTQALSTLSLSPGEALRFQEVWPGVNNAGLPVPAGSYTLVGWVAASGMAELTESSAEITIRDSRRSGPAVSDILRSPKSFLNREITLEGIYRSQLAQRDEPLVEGGPPTSRNDWILRDETGSIYVAGNGGVAFDREGDLNRRFRVHGLVRMNPEGRLYLRAWEVERLSSRRR